MLLARVISLITAFTFVRADSDATGSERPLIEVYEITPQDDLGNMV